MYQGFESRYFTTSDKETIHYILNFNPSLKKEKPVIVFNYGLVCNFKHWEPQLNYFHKQGYPVLSYDYRGHFKSSGKNNIELLTLDQFSKDLNELLYFLHIDKVCMAGHSMGVNVCVNYAVKYPESVINLSLISGTVFDVSNILMNNEFNKVLIPLLTKTSKKYPDSFNRIWEIVSTNFITTEVVRTMGFNTKTVPRSFVKYYLRKVNELGPHIFFQLLNQMTNTNLLPHLPTITQPSLVIVGDNDKVLPPSYQKIIHDNLKNSELFMVKNGSHVPQIDFPKQINAKIESFIKS